MSSITNIQLRNELKKGEYLKVLSKEQREASISYILRNYYFERKYLEELSDLNLQITLHIIKF